MKMTFFWTDDAPIATRQPIKTGVTITLAKTFIRLSIAMNTINLATVLNRPIQAQIVINGYLLLVGGKKILRFIVQQLNAHFSKRSVYCYISRHLISLYY